MSDKQRKGPRQAAETRAKAFTKRNEAIAKTINPPKPKVRPAPKPKPKQRVAHAQGKTQNERLREALKQPSFAQKQRSAALSRAELAATKRAKAEFARRKRKKKQ